LLYKTNLTTIIISILSHNWPLKAKEIYPIVKSQKSVSYQATHKMLEKLVDDKVLSKSVDGYSVNTDFIIKTKKNWEEVAKAYFDTNQYEKQNMVVPDPIYLFQSDCVLINLVPSVFISKSTLFELIEKISSKDLNLIAKSIAEKNYSMIKARLNENDLKDPIKRLVFVEKLNEMANSYHWGNVSFKNNYPIIEIKIKSNTFVTKKAKKFYDTIYVYYMELLGFKFKKMEKLTQSYFFEVKKC
jgi:predicted transcriptional regulator